MAYAIIPKFRDAYHLSAYNTLLCRTYRVQANDEEVLARFAALPFMSDDVNNFEAPAKQFERLTGFPHWEVPLHGLTAIISDLADVELEPPFQWNEKERAASSFKAFKAAQEQGKIVLNPMRAVRLIMEDKHYVRKNAVLATDTTGSIVSGVHKPTVVCKRLPAAIIPYCVDPIDAGQIYNGFYAIAGFDLELCDVELVSLFRDEGRPPVELFLSKLDGLPQKGSLINTARAELHEGVYNLMLDVAEAQETASFITSTLRSILKHARTVMSKERRTRAALQLKRKLGKLTPDDAAAATSSIAGHWMAFRYAVTPLVMSIQDAYKLISKPHPRFTSARKREDEDYTEVIGGWTFTATIEHRCFAKAAIEVDSTYAGLGMNPLHTLWEIAPWSFVIDWVLPIGDFLMGSSEPSWITDSASTYSHKCRKLTISHPQYGEVKCDIDYYRSTILGSQLELDFHPRVNMSWKRWVDATALSWFQGSRLFRR